ncbi:glucose-6-phosphate dehydrogenase [Vagococcus coleopterorum]|uniref:Glucose-6-phosphate 1-dehydrogenase n=1 Tax=Vagococcus coleopterorum TaxID=2714946 RepID=A0A6G8APT4_9ENTE|nr:glucose-6-phosphate dehydrogenase [Vagococcus coleopterorum]QIL46945.1 glucose-6-phosphate dehydrogenase [Vagococcus coleopterorum]
MTDEQTALFTIFGATGDLAQRKLYPSLFRLFRKGFLNDSFAVIGTARRDWSNDVYRNAVSESIQSFQPTSTELAEFISHFYYQAHDVNNSEDYSLLQTLADTLDNKYNLKSNRIFYLAMAPHFFGTITQQLKEQGITTKDGFNRLIIEKPFGSDYQTALSLNNEINAAFEEDQIFRIDHYLGKEMIQNISAIRFGNPLFTSIWNNTYIDNVQVTLAEELGVEDRGGYYDTSGALKDMIQNHTLQVVSLLAMEPPKTFTERDIRSAKIAALNDIKLYSAEEVAENFVRGQYDANPNTGQLAYRQEPNVAPESQTETYVAGKLTIENQRWQGVPFFIRSGKRLSKKETIIHIVFKSDLNPFATKEAAGLLPNNILTIYIQPTEGFSLTLNGKEIGDNFKIEPLKLAFEHSSEALDNSPEAYEKLLLDCLKGDGTNFTHWDEVAQSWRIVDVIRQTWDKQTPDFPNYISGSNGPKCADDLLAKDHAIWI